MKGQDEASLARKKLALRENLKRRKSSLKDLDSQGDASLKPRVNALKIKTSKAPKEDDTD
jgi:hypothetical protein